MMLWCLLVLRVFVVVKGGKNESEGSTYTEDIYEAGKFLRSFDIKADRLMRENGLANWEYETDLSEDNLQKTVNIGLELSEFFLESSQNATKIKKLDLPPKIQRQIILIRRNADPTSVEMRREIKETIGQMTSIFSKAKVQKGSKNYTLTDLTKIMQTSRKKSKLDWAWKSWRDEVGPSIKADYAELIDLLNIGAREHGWIDYGNYLRTDYEMGEDFEPSLDGVWSKIKPLYEELHAYVRQTLVKKYNLNIKRKGCIPASLLGDMFAQNWENIFPLVKPTSSSKLFNVQLKKKDYDVRKMFTLAEDFFTSIGLSKMPATFWNNSVLEKPPNKEMVCHASAWDISKSDVRIKMCAEVNQEDLTTIHHEMGHIEYFLAYKNQPNTFRAGANPGFHEAIGDTISLSVETPSYLKEVVLKQKKDMRKDDTISFLLNQALRRLAPLPYNLLVDKWRWRVFEGNITENNYNKAWWDLRVKYQGVEPPVARLSGAFDPSSKYHIGANIPYVAYFFSYVFQFQLHKALCEKKGHKGPLHMCTIHKCSECGATLKKMLEKGRSQPWALVLAEATGEKELKPDAILEYFKPLKDWLVEQRKSQNYSIKWNDQTSIQVLQKKSKKYEAGQERSGILKTDSGDVSLSINIPAISLAQLVGKNQESSNTTSSAASISPNATLPDPANPLYSNSPAPQTTGPKTAATPMEIDLGKLIAAGKSLSIKSSEFNAINSDGNTETKNKEIDINSVGGNNPVSNFTSATNASTQPGNRTVENTVPMAVQKKPEVPFPPTVVSAVEPKLNPKTAGVEKQHNNPTAAAVPQEPKANPVPPNQIALVPISLPANLINVLRNAMNSSTLTKSNASSIDVASFSPNLVNRTNADASRAPETNATLQKNNTVGDENNTTNPGKYERKNSTDLTDAESAIASNATKENVTTDNKPTNSSLIAEASNATNSTATGNNTTTPEKDSLPDAANFLTTQLVLPCKRSVVGAPCMRGKVLTEGNALPEEKQGMDSADKSTPDPVVNALATPEKPSGIGGFDINQIIKALTGPIKPSNATYVNNTMPDTKQNIYPLNQENDLMRSADIANQESDSVSRGINAVNCTNAQKRGVRLMLKCRDGKHKSGALSLSPQELMQRLLQSKMKNEINRKTIPSANVVGTPNGFQLNFDLSAKDKIPIELSGKISNRLGREQHVDVYNTAKGMVVKPKASLQLLTPQFVPALNKDNMELINKD